MTHPGQQIPHPAPLLAAHTFPARQDAVFNWARDVRHYDHRVQTYTDAEALIDDPRVLASRIADNGEPFVDLSAIRTLATDESPLVIRSEF